MNRGLIVIVWGLLSCSSSQEQSSEISANFVHCESESTPPCAGCSCSVTFQYCEDAGYRQVECFDTECACSIDGVVQSTFDGDFCTGQPWEMANESCDWNLTRERSMRSPSVVRCAPQAIVPTSRVDEAPATSCSQDFECADGIWRSVDCIDGLCACSIDGVEGQTFEETAYCTSYFAQDSLANTHCGWQIVAF